MEIEAVLDNHPAVHASCVVGKADSHFGQIVIAYVQLRDDVAEKHEAGDRHDVFLAE